MRTLKLKAQPTNAFFTTVSQMFGDSSQLPTSVERAVIKSLGTVQPTERLLGSSWKVRLELARLASSLLYGTRATLGLNLPPFEMYI